MTASVSFDFSGKSVLISGSNSGIGLETARAFAKAGANVAINSFTDSDEDHATAKAIAEEFGTDCVYLCADLLKREAVLDLFQKAETAFGAIDILVNNAGIQHVAPIEDFSDDAWNRVIELNLSAKFALSRAVLKGMRKRGWGRIVNVASAHGLHASANKSAYISAKHGLVGLSKTVALETAEDGITCNAICPGYVFTPIIEGQIPDQMAATGLSREDVIRDVLLVKQPTKRFAEMDEIADGILFLCSDAAKSITGTTLSIDGGWSAI